MILAGTSGAGGSEYRTCWPSATTEVSDVTDVLRGRAMVAVCRLTLYIERDRTLRFGEAALVTVQVSQHKQRDNGTDKR